MCNAKDAQETRSKSRNNGTIQTANFFIQIVNYSVRDGELILLEVGLVFQSSDRNC